VSDIELNPPVTVDEYEWVLRKRDGHVVASDLTTADLLRIRRKRDTRNRDELCRAAGISHVTWLKRERAGDPRLVEFWSTQK